MKLKKIIFYFLISFFFIFKPASSYGYFSFLDSLDVDLQLPQNYYDLRQFDILKKEDKFYAVLSARNKANGHWELLLLSSTNGLVWDFEKALFTYGNRDVFSARLREEEGKKIITLTFYENNKYWVERSECSDDFVCNTPSKILEGQGSDESNGVFGLDFLKGADGLFGVYGAWGSGGFNISSLEGSSSAFLKRCQNKTLFYNRDGPFLFKFGKKFFIFFHRSNPSPAGIDFAVSNNLSCGSSWSSRYELLSDPNLRHIIYPSGYSLGKTLYLYYTQLDVSGKWRVRASRFIVQPDFKIVILPGFMSSWNGDAILHNKNVSIGSWKLLPFVTEYDGLINSLKNLGFEENKDFFVVPYDWRKGLVDLSSDLNSFFAEKIFSFSSARLIMIGHSLGGVVGRIYAQEHSDKVEKLITVGSPHKGVVQVYKPVEAGEIERENNKLWLAEKVILVLNKNSLESDKDTILRLMPVIKDLFPVFDFLKKQDGSFIPIGSLNFKNLVLNQYNASFFNIEGKTTFFYSQNASSSDTPAGFVVTNRTLSDEALGIYADGRPLSGFYDKGDKTVLSKSSKLNSGAFKSLSPLDHREIIYKKEAIVEILKEVGVDFLSSSIVEGSRTEVSPSLIFMVKSPVELWVEHNGSLYKEFDGIVFISNAESGDYTVKLKGKSIGKYTLYIGQIASDNDVWEVVQGEITANPPDSQIDEYSFYFDSKQAGIIFPTPTLTPTPTPTPKLTASPTPASTPTSTPTPTPISTSTTVINSSTPTPTSEKSSSPISFNKLSEGLKISPAKASKEVLGEKVERKEERGELGRIVKNNKKSRKLNLKDFVKIFFAILIASLIFLFFFKRSRKEI